MRPLLDWLINELKDPAKAATGMLGSTITFIVLVVFRAVRDERKRSAEEAKKVTPIEVCTVTESREDIVATARKFWALEQEISDLRMRLASVDADRKAVSADAIRTASALGESERRVEALVRELADLRASIEGGHTRVAAMRPVHAVELDAQPIEDRPTPTHGRAKAKGR
jgi:septal ring factor EnvC (AmiA/AmiB activator)